MLIARASYGITDYCNASTQQYHQRSSLVEREVQAVNDGVKQAQEETYLHKGMSRSKYNDYTPEERAQIGSQTWTFKDCMTLILTQALLLP